MMVLPRVNVIGAGFSGLVSAYYLVEAGYEVDLFESSDRVGGLIQTVATPVGRIETAANGMLSSALVEKLCDQVGVELVAASRIGKKRFIFRGGKPQRWPLGVGETFQFLRRVMTARGKQPRLGETVQDWTVRVLGLPAYHYLVTPALQGIYAGNPEEMSAELIFGKFFAEKIKRPPSRFHGSVAPRGGMGELTEKLRHYLIAKGVRLQYRSSPSLRTLKGPVVVATSLPEAVKILAESFPIASQTLGRVQMLPLVSVSLSFPRESPHLDGFGCVFARDEGIRALGVLFEESIFGGRSAEHMERWILGGATDPGVLGLGDEELIAVILQDRAKLLGSKGTEIVSPLATHITRWKTALPHCTLILRDALQSPELGMLATEKEIFLMGNYMGKLGLSGILETASQLPQRLRPRASPL